MRIIGTVQRVGYRHIVQNIARKHNITGTIENLEGYDVRIVAEGTRKDLEAFKEAIKISEYPILVECIESSEEPYLGCFSYFQVIRGSPEEELAERFDSAIAIFSRMERKQDQALEMHKESIGLQQETLGLQKETISLQKETLGLQKETLELQKETLELQKETISLQKETLGLQKETISLQKETLGLQKETLGLQKETISLQTETVSLQKETLEEIKGTRSDLDKGFNSELREMREELREIRNALIHAGIMQTVKS
jgi:acylphosphatase